MMTKKKARANAAYEAVMECATDLLAAVGEFSFDEVLERTRMVGLEFEWHLVREIIEEDYGEPLFAVSRDRFSRKKGGDSIGKQVAVGYGKRTAGYAVARAETQDVIKASLKIRRNQIIGAGREFTSKRVAAMAQVDAIGSDVAALTVNGNGAQRLIENHA